MKTTDLTNIAGWLDEADAALLKAKLPADEAAKDYITATQLSYIRRMVADLAKRIKKQIESKENAATKDAGRGVQIDDTTEKGKTGVSNTTQRKGVSNG